MLAWLRLRKQVKPRSPAMSQKKKAREVYVPRAFLFVGIDF